MSEERPTLPQIRPLQEADWPQVSRLLRRTFATGDSYPYPADLPEAELRQMWWELPRASFVACVGASVVGTYYLKANMAGRGNHVCNCGYVVDAAHAGRGLATMLCEHSQQTARAAGFSAMQFNSVVATNTRALALWQRLGFAVVGRIPAGFRHDVHGLVDLVVMHKTLGA